MTTVKERASRAAVARMRPGEPWPAIAGRVLLAVTGGYVLSRTAVWFVAVALTATGIVPRADAVVFAPMSGFVIYLAILVWAFADPRLGRVGLILAGAQASMFVLAWALS